MVKQHKNGQHDNGKDYTEIHFPCFQCKNGCRTKQGGAHIARNIRRCRKQVHQQITKSKCPNRDHGDGGVPLDPGVLTGAKQEDGDRDCHGQDNEHVVCDLEYCGNGKGPEGHMGKTVTNVGVTLEYQGHAQKRRAERNQDAYDNGVAHKGEI